MTQGELDSELIDAAYEGRIDGVKDALSKGANINGADYRIPRNYVTALVRAAENGHLDIVKYLMEHGSYINYGDPLFESFHNRHTHVVRYLIEKGARLDEDGKKYFIEHARRNGWKSMLSFLSTVDCNFHIHKKILT